MGTARSRCGRCGERVEVGLERVVLALPEAALADQAGELVFACPTCDAAVVRQVPPALLAVLVASGVTTLPMQDVSELVPPHPEGPAHSAPLCLDDVLALHALLQSDDWFAVLAAGELGPSESGDDLTGER